VVENRPGANGSIGGNAVNTAEPDGTTLLFSAGTHVMAREVMKKAPYDPIDDFAAIARVGEAPMMLVVSPRVAANTVQELIAEAARPRRNGRSERQRSARPAIWRSSNSIASHG
jgi:tripartite-type tricarboxylate transporter receptor subunit TctC